MVEVKNSTERYKLRTASIEDIKSYWDNQVELAREDLSKFEDLITSVNEKDYEIMSTLSFKKSYVELIEKAVSLEQYKRCTTVYEPATRVLRIKIDLPRPLIEKYFNLKTISLYGIGLYAPIEGLLLSAGFRSSSKYDESCRPVKEAPLFDISNIPEDIRKDYAFNLAIPASDGLFVPKKCTMTKDWLYTTRQLEYLDLL